MIKAKTLEKLCFLNFRISNLKSTSKLEFNTAPKIKIFFSLIINIIDEKLPRSLFKFTSLFINVPLKKNVTIKSTFVANNIFNRKLFLGGFQDQKHLT